MQYPIDQSRAVSDETGFSRRAGAFAKTSVIDCNDVSVGLSDQVAISVRSPTLGYMASVSMDFPSSSVSEPAMNT